MRALVDGGGEKYLVSGEVKRGPKFWCHYADRGAEKNFAAWQLPKILLVPFESHERQQRGAHSATGSGTRHR
jgi:hypothetical protein